MKKNPFLKYCNLILLLLVPVLTAGSATVSWDANSEPDLAGYKIYYGKGPASYETQVYVGNVTSYRLTGLEEGKPYYFAVTALDYSGNESSFSLEVSAIIKESPPDDPETGETNLTQALIGKAYNYPNPFRVDFEETTIRYELQNSGPVTIEILDSNTDYVTTLVENEFRAAGEHTSDIWDGRNANGRFVANGVYFCNIRANQERRIVKIAVTR